MTELPEICHYCGKEFANTKALGSHIYYRHRSNSPTLAFEAGRRSSSELKRFRSILKKCLFTTGLKMPKDIEKIEAALTEVPPGISPLLDKYRDAFARALNKETLLKEVEEILRREET